ncbi:MAG: stage II sporulation protein M [Methanomicrobia archaeon]|nr:stage II sporulation protein M [Methanomicrobia archaeon]
MELLKRNKGFILVGVILFVIGGIAGYTVYLNNPDLANLEGSSIFSGLEQKISFFQNLNILGKIIFIFLNNLLVALISVFLGAILGLFPIFIALMNGFVVGIVAGKVLESNGIGYLLVGLVPHGIFEIPAILIAIGLGLKFGYLIISTIISILLGKSTKDNEFKLFIRELKPAFKIILILLCIGAFVEILITPLLITIIGG